MTRTQARRQYTSVSSRDKRFADFFSLTPLGVRVGYASRELLEALSSSQRNSLRGRVVLVLTAKP